MKFKSLSNVRPSKDLGTQLILLPTKGGIKITETAAKAIGVISGDYIELVQDTDKESPTCGQFYAVAGSKDEDKQVGSKVARNGATYQFSAAAAWQDMEGSEQHNSYYDVQEEGVEVDGRTYHLLTFSEKVAKQARVKKSVEGDTTEIPVSQPLHGEEVFDDTSEVEATSTEVDSETEADFEEL